MRLVSTGKFYFREHCLFNTRKVFPGSLLPLENFDHPNYHRHTLNFSRFWIWCHFSSNLSVSRLCLISSELLVPQVSLSQSRRPVCVCVSDVLKGIMRRSALTAAFEYWTSKPKWPLKWLTVLYRKTAGARETEAIVLVNKDF